MATKRFEPRVINKSWMVIFCCLEHLLKENDVLLELKKGKDLGTLLKKSGMETLQQNKLRGEIENGRKNRMGKRTATKQKIILPLMGLLFQVFKNTKEKS